MTPAALAKTLSLPVFSQMLEPAGIAPALDFNQSGQLVYSQLPSLDLRSKVRFVIGDEVVFRAGTTDEVARLIKHWRAELSPQIAGGDDQFSGFSEVDDFSANFYGALLFPSGKYPFPSRTFLAFLDYQSCCSRYALKMG